MSDANLATLLVMISAFMHASWNAVVKSSSDRVSSMAVVDGVAFLVALAALPLVPLPSTEVWVVIALSTVVNLFYRYFLIRAYHFGDFGQVYPLVRGCRLCWWWCLPRCGCANGCPGWALPAW